MAAARRITVAVLAVGITLLIVVGVFPTRTWLAQQASARRAQDELAALEEENADLEQQARDLQDPETVADIARRDFSMVMPGEEAYVVLPPPDETADDTSEPSVVAPTDVVPEETPTGVRRIVQLTWQGLTDLW